MSVGPTLGKPGFRTSQATSAQREEKVEKPWDFVLGLLAKSLRLYGAGASSGAMLVASDSEGNTEFSSTIPAERVQLTGQTANQTATIVASGSATGEWAAYLYAQCTTAGSAGSLTVTLSYTDDIGATTTAALCTVDLTGTNRDDGFAVLRCSGGGIDYTATITGGGGSPQYALHINLVRLRAV